MKKIKIIKCGPSKYWYSNHINEVFDLYDEDIFNAYVIYNGQKKAIGNLCYEHLDGSEKPKGIAECGFIDENGNFKSYNNPNLNYYNI